MTELQNVCSRCNADVNAQFNTPGGLRQREIITTDLFWSQPCFVRDIIEFRDAGRLIFQTSKEVPGPEGGQPNYAVICRRLIINGGNKPMTLTPCNPGDPGTRYERTNVITWDRRLHGAPNGAPPPPKPPDGPQGVLGTDGVTGNAGSSGSSAPRKLTVFALEVDVQNGGHLVIDWGGQDGGDGGRGQNGGRGGRGNKGSAGQDESWPGGGCETPTGDGGTGMTGGRGGDGGPGGQGGDGGTTVVISTPANLAGVFSSSSIVFVNDAGLGGRGGQGGLHGAGGPGGPPGNRSSDCDPGNPGADGTPGDDGTDIVTSGASGAPGHLAPFEPVAPGTCADKAPVAMVFDPIASPFKICRCFSGSGSGDISITGQFLDQVDTVTTSLAGVTATKKASSTDTQLDLKIQVTAASALGVGNLIVKPVLGPTQNLAGAIDVERCQINTITPNTGARGATVGVTIVGECFDVTAPFHDVVIGGLGVNAVNVAVVDDQTMTCQIEIASGAATGARDVTVRAGAALSPCQHALIGGFTVT
jgi:hypothetical protein